MRRSGAGRSRSPWLLVIAAAGALACDLPRDPEGTLRQARGDTLRVGAVEAPPYVGRSGDEATGPEAELVHAFAESIGAEVEWRWAPLDEHMRALEAFELDVVVAGLTKQSPWASKVGFTRPWLQEGDVQRVLAVAPGENATLVALERVIEESRRS